MDQEEFLEALGMDEPEEQLLADWEVQELRHEELLNEQTDADLDAEEGFQRYIAIEGEIQHHQYHIEMLELQQDRRFNVQYTLENGLIAFHSTHDGFTEADILAMIAFSTFKYAEIPAPPSVNSSPESVFGSYDPEALESEDEYYFENQEAKYSFAGTHLEYEDKYYVVPAELPFDYITAWENAGSPDFSELAARNSEKNAASVQNFFEQQYNKQNIFSIYVRPNAKPVKANGSDTDATDNPDARAPLPF